MAKKKKGKIKKKKKGTPLSLQYNVFTHEISLLREKLRVETDPKKIETIKYILEILTKEDEHEKEERTQRKRSQKFR